MLMGERESDSELAPTMATVVSCPGKVLLAGGYLVLDPAHAGLVVATPARFFTVIHRRAAPGVSVTSPQFTDDPLRYTLVAGVLAQEHGRQNPFVHKALQATLALVAAVQPTLPPPALAVTILAQNDFYSQPRSDLAPVPFAHLHVSIANVNKTGLGSSAAMVTSLTAALFLHLTNDTSPSPSTLALIHNLAQYVHSLAQGKVGSGFDVSAAMYGSQRYTRFPVEALGDLLKEGFVVRLPAQLFPCSRISADGRGPPSHTFPRAKFAMARVVKQRQHRARPHSDSAVLDSCARRRRRREQHSQHGRRRDEVESE